MVQSRVDLGPPGMAEEIRRRIHGGREGGREEKDGDEQSNSVTPLKHPMCLDTRRFEVGITCKPVKGGLPYQTTISVPPQPADFPAVVQCPAYVAPEHGSVWCLPSSCPLPLASLSLPLSLSLCLSLTISH